MIARALMGALSWSTINDNHESKKIITTRKTK
jgi:hypothetical protein